jgi:hypothetical protein
VHAVTRNMLTQKFICFREFGSDRETLRGITLSPPSVTDEEDHSAAESSLRSAGTEKIIDTTKRDPLTGSLLQSEKNKLMQLLDNWEEPDVQAARNVCDHATNSEYPTFQMSHCVLLSLTTEQTSFNLVGSQVP